MAARANKAWLNPRYLLIALLPALVFTFSAVVIAVYATPMDVPPLKFAEFDVNKEGAARVGALAAFMLFMGAALAALLFFSYTLRMFDWRGRVMPFLAFLAMAFAALLVSSIGEGGEPHDFSGRSLACFAAGYNEAQSGASPQRPLNIVAIAHLPTWLPCSNQRFETMRSLGLWQFWGVVFSFASLVLGAICCLATRPPAQPAGKAASRAISPPAPGSTPGDEPAPPDDPELQHWERQSQWLNTYLYLAAFLLAAALLFINAYLRWPAYVLTDATAYHQHTAALVSYYGIVFSIMLAAFYIPVATILAGKVQALKPATSGESKLPDAFKGPFQILKIVLGLFSTALAGALPGILDLIG